MTIGPIALLAHLVLLAWATRVVCRRTMDRRQPRTDDVASIRFSWVCAVVCLVAAAVFDLLDGGRRLAVVRGLWELGMASVCLTAGLAIRVLQGGRRA